MATKKNANTHPVTEAEKQHILDLHAKGMSRNDIARETGRSQPIVSRTVHNAGGTFDRSKTEAATKAALADRKKRRADIIDRLYTRTEKALERLEGEQFRALVPTGPGRQEPKDLDFIPGAEERQIASSMTSYLTAAANLEKVDAVTETHSAVDSWLEHVTGGPLDTMEEAKRPPEAGTSEGPSTTG